MWRRQLGLANIINALQLIQDPKRGRARLAQRIYYLCRILTVIYILWQHAALSALGTTGSALSNFQLERRHRGDRLTLREPTP